VCGAGGAGGGAAISGPARRDAEAAEADSGPPAPGGWLAGAPAGGGRDAPSPASGRAAEAGEPPTPPSAFSAWAATAGANDAPPPARGRAAAGADSPAPASAFAARAAHGDGPAPPASGFAAASDGGAGFERDSPMPVSAFAAAAGGAEPHAPLGGWAAAHGDAPLVRSAFAAPAADETDAQGASPEPAEAHGADSASGGADAWPARSGGFVGPGEGAQTRGGDAGGDAPALDRVPGPPDSAALRKVSGRPPLAPRASAEDPASVLAGAARPHAEGASGQTAAGDAERPPLSTGPHAPLPPAPAGLPEPAAPLATVRAAAPGCGADEEAGAAGGAARAAPQCAAAVPPKGGLAGPLQRLFNWQAALR